MNAIVKSTNSCWTLWGRRITIVRRYHHQQQARCIVLPRTQLQQQRTAAAPSSSCRCSSDRRVGIIQQHQQHQRRRCFSSSDDGPLTPVNAPTLTNGNYMKHAMLYHDSVAFLVSNDLGIPAWIASSTGGGGGGGTATPRQVADRFELSVRAASALLVTLCRMEVVSVSKDSDDSVDDIAYELTPSAAAFLGDPHAEAYTSPFVDTFATNFLTPEKLLEEYARPEAEASQQDIMSEHLEQSDEQVANNARHFMRHMNAQSHCCAKAFPASMGLDAASTLTEPIRLLDVGGGSGIFAIEAARSNPLVEGVVLELEAIKSITEEYITAAGLSNQVTVEVGDFFTDDPFPSNADVVLFSNILHDWPDKVNVDLLQKAYACLNPGGRVVISELLLADDVRSSTCAATSMNVIMIAYAKGRQYRPKELHRRLERIGFVRPVTMSLVDDYGLVIAGKPL